MKTAIKATFTNRGANFQKLSIPKDQIENIQRYWGIYLKATDVEMVPEGQPITLYHSHKQESGNILRPCKKENFGQAILEIIKK